MASIELVNQIKKNDEYISKKGINKIVSDGELYNVIDAYINSIKCGMFRDNDSKYALEISKKTKNIINDAVLIQSQGGTIQDLEVYRSESNAEYKILNKFYDVLRLEAPYLVDSFFYYMEIDERDPYKRFYFPRRKVLNPVITAYQDVYDGKLDFLSVSQPKRTGKTTSGLKLAQMMGGRDPDGSIFGVGKGEGLVKRFYGGLLQDFETDRTYQRFLSVFPEAKKIGEKDYKVQKIYLLI